MVDLERREGEHTWPKVVALIQDIFRDGVLPQRMTHRTLVLIPKRPTEVRGVGLVEMMWKILSRIIHKRIMSVINFHLSIHGFRKGKGTGTDTLEVKLLASFSGQKKETVFKSF